MGERRLKSSIVIMGVLICLVGSAVAADLLVYEPFDYTLGADLNGQGGAETGLTGTWSAAGGPTDFSRVTNGLTFGLMPVSGNAMARSDTREGTYVWAVAARELSINSGNTYYMSWLFKDVAYPSGNPVNYNHSLAVTDGPTKDATQSAAGVVGQNASRVMLSGTFSSSGPQPTLGETYLFVMEIAYDGATTTTNTG